MMISPIMLEWLFAREVVRRLGFAPDEIFFVVNDTGRVQEGDRVVDLGMPVIGLQLVRGGLTFLWSIGGINLAPDRVHAAYERACALWNAGEIDVNHGDFLASRPARQAIRVMMALQAKGFRLGSPAPN